MPGTPWQAAEASWRAKLSLAQSFMAERACKPSTLIEVAAQHPLVEGLRPNDEFRCRLDRGQEIYHSEKEAGRTVEIYVPGSRHSMDGVADRVSLSAAGRSYLIEQGVPQSLVHGDDLNVKYKGSDGVYCSADECYVASTYYKEAGFGSLVSICSPGQMLRKTLHYIEFGVVPLNFTVPVLHGFHDYMNELFIEIPKVLTIDASLQGDDSSEARRLRAERQPLDVP